MLLRFSCFWLLSDTLYWFSFLFLFQSSLVYIASSVCGLGSFVSIRKFPPVCHFLFCPILISSPKIPIIYILDLILCYLFFLCSFLFLIVCAFCSVPSVLSIFFWPFFQFTNFFLHSIYCQAHPWICLIIAFFTSVIRLVLCYSFQFSEFSTNCHLFQLL